MSEGGKKRYRAPGIVRVLVGDPRVAHMLIVLEEEKQRRAELDVLEQLARFRP
jgi:hypothetical protein